MATLDAMCSPHGRAPARDRAPRRARRLVLRRLLGVGALALACRSAPAEPPQEGPAPQRPALASVAPTPPTPPTTDAPACADDRGYAGPGAVGEVTACVPSTSAPPARTERPAAATEGDEGSRPAADEATDDDADDAPPPRRAPPALDVDTARARLGGCRTEPIERLLARVAGSDDAGERATLVDHGPRTILRLRAAGNGIYGGWSEGHVAVHRERCAVDGRLSLGGSDWSLVTDAQLSARGEAAQALLAAADLRRFKDDAASALPRLLVSPAAPVQRAPLTGATLVGPLYRPQPAFPGTPRRGRATLVDAADVRPFGVTFDAWRSDEDPTEDPPSQLYVAGVGAAKATRRFGQAQLYEAALPGRNGGVAVALHDRASGRHRWVLTTRGRVLGSWIRWVGEARGLIFGEYASEHPGDVYAGQAGIVVLRRSDGAAFRLDVDGAFEDGERVDYLGEEARLYDRVDACVRQRLGVDDLDDDDLDRRAEARARARCERDSPPPHNLELRGDTLRIRRPDDAWIELPIAALARAAAD
ncbi:MAG: hypothetical protein R3A79_16810 [Nannocystaceae bacterium]